MVVHHRARSRQQLSLRRSFRVGFGRGQVSRRPGVARRCRAGAGETAGQHPRGHRRHHQGDSALPQREVEDPDDLGRTWPFAEGKYGSTYEADTADTYEKVLDYYEKEMASRGWKGQRTFKGMISFEKPSARGKLITLVSGPDDKVPGQTLLRVLVQDQ